MFFTTFHTSYQCRRRVATIFRHRLGRFPPPNCGDNDSKTVQRLAWLAGVKNVDYYLITTTSTTTTTTVMNDEDHNDDDYKQGSILTRQFLGIVTWNWWHKAQAAHRSSTHVDGGDGGVVGGNHDASSLHRHDDDDNRQSRVNINSNNNGAFAIPIWLICPISRAAAARVAVPFSILLQHISNISFNSSDNYSNDNDNNINNMTSDLVDALWLYVMFNQKKTYCR
jgi:hypothetical protein